MHVNLADSVLKFTLIATDIFFTHVALNPLLVVSILSIRRIENTVDQYLTSWRMFVVTLLPNSRLLLE